MRTVHVYDADNPVITAGSTKLIHCDALRWHPEVIELDIHEYLPFYEAVCVPSKDTWKP